MDIGRRSLLLAASAAAVSTVVVAARADTIDLALSCDTTIAPALRAVAQAYRATTGVHVFVFATGPGLVVPQLLREVQIDLVVTQDATLAKAVQAGVIAQGAQSGPWRDRLVIAGLRGGPKLSPNVPIAASDPSPASDVDGPAVLAQLGLHHTPMLGAIDGNGVTFLIMSGAATAGLLRMTDVRAEPRLDVLRVVPDDAYPQRMYRAGTAAGASPGAAAFIAFLAATDAARLLAEHGLEPVT